VEGIDVDVMGAERPKEVHWHVNPVMRAVYDRAEHVASDLLADRKEIRVLDIGAGIQSSVIIPATTHLVGVDVDEVHLAGNESLDERIVVGVEDLDFPDESFDGIVTVYALEHVARPDLAFARMARLLKPGGVVIAIVPNVSSAKAVLTRYTPTGFHVWVYRHLLDRKDVMTDADDDGGPFPTVLHGSLRRDRVEQLLPSLGLDVVHLEQFEDNKQRYFREKIRLVDGRWDAVRKVSRGCLGNAHDPGFTEFVVVAQKRAD
jgi:SAM-dependent methyltransferase